MVPEDTDTRTVTSGEFPPQVTTLIVFLGLAPSVSEAQRLIESGAVHVNDDRIADVKAEITNAGEYLFKVGKRRFIRLVVQKERGTAGAVPSTEF